MAEPSGNQGGGSGAWGQIAAALVATAGNALGRGGPKRSYKYAKKLAQFQNEINRTNAEWAFQKELELRDAARQYDSPAAQMARYKDAGLNPNLVYGQGTPGNIGQTHAPSIPGVHMQGVDVSWGNLGTEFQQARLMAAQTDLTRTKTEESSVKQDLAKAQQRVLEVNPYLDKNYLQAIVTNMESVAALKKQEASYKLEEVTGLIGSTAVHKPTPRGYLIMEEQMQQLMQKFRLNELQSKNREEDLKIKAQVIQSKDFENALKAIQVRFMEDGDITPQHILEFVKMFLAELMISGRR